MKLVFNGGEEVLKVGYQAMLETPELANRINFTFEQFKVSCKDFEVWGFYDKEPVGMLFFKQNSPHIAIIKSYHGKCGKVIKLALKEAVNKFGSLITEVHCSNEKAINFVEKLGFNCIERTKDTLIYEYKS